MDTQTITISQVKKPKKQLLVRKKLDETIAQSKVLEKHPFLPNTMVEVNQQSTIMKKHTFKNAGDMVRRASRMLSRSMKQQDSRVLTNQSQRSFDSQMRSKYIPQKGQMEEDNHICEVEGPQVKMSQNFISFMQITGKVAFDSVIVTNNGNASIYYEWESVENEKCYSQTLKEIEQKFFCHHEQNVIKPGEEKKFVFSFLSNVTGIFNQEWVLNCQPPTTKPIPRIKLTGHAIIMDDHIQWRHDFSRMVYESYVFKGMQEIVNDVIAQVKTPTPPLPDLQNPDVCRIEFEEKNKAENLYYNPLVIKWWRHLEQSLYEELHLNPEDQYWDMNINYLRELIDKIQDEEIQQFFESRFRSYLDLSKKPPVERSSLWNTFRSKIEQVVDNIPQLSDDIRRELELWEYQFNVPSDSESEDEEEVKTEQQNGEDDQNNQYNENQEEDQEQQEEKQLSEEEILKQQQKEQRKLEKQERKAKRLEKIQQQEEELNKIKGEWAKKRKKKLTEDDEKNLVKQYRDTLLEKSKEFQANLLEGIEEQSQYLRIDHTIQNGNQSKEFYEDLMRKMQVSDIEIEGKKILMKFNLNIKQDEESLNKFEIFKEMIVKQKEEEIKKQEEERLLQEKLAKEKKKGRRPQPKKKKKEEEQVEEEPKLDLSFLEEKNFEYIINQIKFYLERGAKLLMLLPSFDKPTACYQLPTSTKFFYEYLKTIIENPIYFQENLIIENYEEKVENEAFAENSIIFFENCNFEPCEINYRIGKQVKKSVLEEEERQRLEELENQQNQEQEAEVQQQETKEQSKNTKVLEQEGSQHDQQQTEQKQFEIFQAKTDLEQEQELIQKYDEEDLEDTLVKYDYEKKKEFVEQINEYCTYLVQDDKHNFFGQNTTMVDLQLESNVLGQQMGQEIMSSAYLMTLERDPYIVFLGGLITPDKLVSLNNFLKKADRIVLLGEFGLAAYLNSRKIDNLLDLKVDNLKRQYLQKILDLNQDTEAQIVIPDDFLTALQPKLPKIKPPEEEINEKDVKKASKKGGKKQQEVTPKEEEEDDEDVVEPESEEYYEFLFKNFKNWQPASKYIEMGEEGQAIEKELENPIDEGYIVIDYGRNTLDAINDSIDVARKLVWVDCLSLKLNHQKQNITTVNAGKHLYKAQQVKNERLEKEKQDPLYDFATDQVTFVYGSDIEKSLQDKNLSEDQIPSIKVPALEEEDNGEENAQKSEKDPDQSQSQAGSQQQEEQLDDQKSTVSGQDDTKKAKTQNINIIADFYIEDTQFAFKFLRGDFIHALYNISSFPLNTEPDIDEGLSFLDDLKLE